jgi:hypothetical protein
MRTAEIRIISGFNYVLLQYNIYKKQNDNYYTSIAVDLDKPRDSWVPIHKSLTLKYSPPISRSLRNPLLEYKVGLVQDEITGEIELVKYFREI